MMTPSPLRTGTLFLVPLLLIAAAMGVRTTNTFSLPNTNSANAAQPQAELAELKVQYLEIVTSTMNETCEALAAAHGVVFSDPIPELGNARTADLRDGGRLGVRAPIGDNETPVVRPYVLVDDIEAAVKAAEAAGGVVAMPPTKIPGQGTFSIYILGGIEHGLWKL